MKAIQDHYPPEFAHCYGCGPANPHGLHLKSYLDDDGTVAMITPDPMFSGGVPGNLYGGMIASLLDCHGTASAAGFACRARGRDMDDDLVRFVTASLKVDYRRPTPLGVELAIRGRLISLKGRKAIIALTLHAGDDLCAEGEMVAVEFRMPARD